MIRLDPEELEQQAARVEQLAQEFGAGCDQAQREVEGLAWEGNARQSFVDMFENARRQFHDVETCIEQIANTLRQVRRQMQELDEGLGSSIQS